MERRLRLLAGIGLFLILPGLVAEPSSQLEEFTDYLVVLESDGDALWLIEHKFPIGSKEEEEGFREYIRSLGGTNEKIEGVFRRIAEEVASEASRVTGRAMAISDLSVNVSITQTITGRLGVISVSFLWSGFGEVVDGELRVGDVFQGGLYLFEGDTLTFRIPEGSQLSTISPKPDRESGRDFSWRGRRSFNSGEPSLSIALEVSQGGGGLGGPLLPLMSDVLLITILAALGTGIAAVLVLSRKRARGIERVSDVELILRIIQRQGGVVTQSRIVEETGFSKSKVSLLLSLMEERGLVERVKVGRENTVRLTRR